MERQPLPLRTVVLMTAAFGTGSLAGAAVEAIAAHLGTPNAGVGHAAAAIVSLWTLDKVNALVGTKAD